MSEAFEGWGAESGELMSHFDFKKGQRLQFHKLFCCSKVILIRRMSLYKIHNQTELAPCRIEGLEPHVLLAVVSGSTTVWY